jgi:hypothetical protein
MEPLRGSCYFWTSWLALMEPLCGSYFFVNHKASIDGTAERFHIFYKLLPGEEIFIQIITAERFHQC